jgi:hypothetical protein
MGGGKEEGGVGSAGFMAWNGEMELFEMNCHD